MQPYGIQSMLKEGHRHLSGLDEAVVKNIDACKQLSTITRTSLGPNGFSHFWMIYSHSLFLFLFYSLCFDMISYGLAEFIRMFKVAVLLGLLANCLNPTSHLALDWNNG